MSDETGAIVAHKSYHPFGLDTEYFASGYTEAHPTGFTGGLELTGTGLVWLGARILDSDVGRFLSPDPVRQEIQQYTYALGNPIWFWDPDGRQETPQEWKATGNQAAALTIWSAAAAVGGAILKSTALTFIGTAGVVVFGYIAIYSFTQANQALLEGGSGGSRGDLVTVSAPFGGPRWLWSSRWQLTVHDWSPLSCFFLQHPVSGCLVG